MQMQVRFDSGVLMLVVLDFTPAWCDCMADACILDKRKHLPSHWLLWLLLTCTDEANVMQTSQIYVLALHLQIHSLAFAKSQTSWCACFLMRRQCWPATKNAQGFVFSLGGSTCCALHCCDNLDGSVYSALLTCMLPDVDPARLRFDFSNNGVVDVPKLAAIETICRDWVAKGLPVSAKEVSLAQAKAIKGLRAVFGEVRRC
jgi:hypothetical protein